MNRRVLLAHASAAALIGSPALAQPLPVIGDVVPPRTAPGPLWTGVPPGASLDLSFLTPGTLDARVSFARASGGTYFDQTGTMQNAAINAPRWDYNPSTLALNGLLIEEARTNIWLQSANAANAAWNSGAITVPPPFPTANQAIAPDGTLTAASVLYPAVSGAGALSSLQQSPTMTAAVYTFSVWLKGSVGGEQVYLCTTPDAVTYYRTLCTLTTAWRRFTLVTGTLTAAAWYFQVGVDLRDASQTSKPVQTIYVWGGQLEQGAFATSLIPTTAAAVTRGADSCTISPANMGFYVPPNVSWFAEFISLDPGAANARIVGYPAANNRAQIFVLGGNLIGQYDGGGSMGVANAIVVGAVSKAATTWAASVASACVNGAAVASSGALTIGFGDAAAWGTGIMQYGVSGQGLSGYIRRATYWPRVLSNAEMQQVTR